ncbi:MAG: hypothetical protein DME23_13530 [Verrucomicrobia bacterium]|nr:MAG: hypothetical protein DME23_13530 [Verrucomicrobiota bacterium]
MPTFGDYETVGEPVATRDERGHVSTIWQARKSRESGGRLYAIKCYAPRRRQPGEGSSGEALDEDLGLEFLEGIKQLKKAHSEGGSCLASIHAFGIAATGAWYVTDFYPRNTLKAWVARHGSVDSAAVRHVVYSVVTGCLVLKRSRGYSHGNLKSGNVFLVGKPRPLRKTPLHLGDPYPAAPLQLSRLDADDRHSPGELLQKVTEARDLRAIGELILELVEGRLVQSGYDYNYPVAPSPAWDRLGRDGERWRQLCNRLLDPQLSSAQVNLESLAKEFRPNPVIAKLPVILSVLGVICAVGGGVYLASHLIKQSSKQRQETREAKRRATLEIFDSSITNANKLLEDSNYSLAAVEFQKAVKLAGELNDTDKKKAAEQGQGHASMLAQAKAAGLVEDEIKALEEALKFKQDAKVEAWLADARRRKEQGDQERTLAQKRSELDKAMADGERLLGQTNYAQAAVEFQKAVKLAGELNDTDKKKAADEGERFAVAVSQAKAAGWAEDEIKSFEEALKVRKDAKVEAWLADAKRRKEQSEQQRTLAQKRIELDKAIVDGNRLLGQTNYAQAAVEFQKAVKLAGELNDTDKKKAAEQGQGYANALAQAKAAGRIEDEIKSLEEALRVN